MDNRVFWVQYQQNQPVKIKTNFIGENERKIPLQDVSDLIQGIY
jgi:hypothetical protein